VSAEGGKLVILALCVSGKENIFLPVSSYPGHNFVAISGMMLMHLAAIMLIQMDW
jgi:hypothetical protein